MRDIAYKMTANTKKYVYAMNVYGTALYDKEIIKRSILKGMTAERQEKIIAHPQFGMNSISTTAQWMDAISEGP
jgi:hypothetical protein